MSTLFNLSRRRVLGLVGANLAATSLPGVFKLAGAAKPAAPTLPDRLDLGVPFGRIGPGLIAAGAIVPERFEAVYQQAGQPLTQLQREVLLEGSDRSIVLDQVNAYFLLNLLWALGLTNDNQVLTQGPMLRSGLSKVGQYASTGGWRLGRKPVLELYASEQLVSLTEEQQARAGEVASGVYRPCCDNPTSFPDCNHGMAMLALLQLLAAHNFSTDDLFIAAKAANRFWYPSETLRLATYFKAAQSVEYAQADARQAMGRQMFSISGYRRIEAWLRSNGLEPALPATGSQEC
jgi:hypothetical protein